MPKFRYRLASLLKLREATRDERRAELAEAYQAETVLAQRRRELDGAIRDNREQLRETAGAGQINVDTLVGGHRHQLLLAAQQQLMDRQRQQLETEIERRRERLVEADQEVRAMEKLRERQQGRFQYEEDRKEVKRLDEVAARCGRQEDAN